MKDAMELMKARHSVRQYLDRQIPAELRESLDAYAEELNRKIKEVGLDSKFFRAAHVIRGGRPTARDRVTAARMACYAVEKLVEGKSNLVVCENEDKIDSMDITLALITDRMYKNKLKPDKFWNGIYRVGFYLERLGWFW